MSIPPVPRRDVLFSSSSSALERVAESVLPVPSQSSGLDASPVVVPPSPTELLSLRKEPFRQDLLPLQGPLAQALEHGRSLLFPLLPTLLQVVAPDQQDRQPETGVLPPLAPGQGLSSVIGVAVA